jgi:hypothetical protein
MHVFSRRVQAGKCVAIVQHNERDRAVPNVAIVASGAPLDRY